MKQVYAIYCTVELIDSPQWLQNFRAKYDKPYDFHITLKQMAYIDRSLLPTIRKRLEGILKITKLLEQTEIIFGRVLLEKFDPTSGTGFIYVFASHRNALLDSLQKNIREDLADYSDYYLKNSKSYEYNFKPHITIGRNLDAKTFDKAAAELPEQVICVGKVTNIVLSCVPELTIEESKKPENLIIYPL